MTMNTPYRPLTPEQERGWRESIAENQWGSTPRWSSQSVAALLATLDATREALDRALWYVDHRRAPTCAFLKDRSPCDCRLQDALDLAESAMNR
jgi:hypothetical protein